jgi:hypothetical protein
MRMMGIREALDDMAMRFPAATLDRTIVFPATLN